MKEKDTMTPELIKSNYTFIQGECYTALQNGDVDFVRDEKRTAWYFWKFEQSTL